MEWMWYWRVVGEVVRRVQYLFMVGWMVAAVGFLRVRKEPKEWWKLRSGKDSGWVSRRVGLFGWVIFGVCW